MNKDDVLKIIDGRTYYYTDYVYYLYDELKKRDEIIKEVREYINWRLEELTIRIAKLQCYLENNSTHDEKTELMEKQIEMMFGYKEVLKKRILLEMK